MTLMTSDVKVKHVDQYNELQLKHLEARARMLEALSIIAMVLALAVIVAATFGAIWAVVMVCRWLV